MPLSVPQMLIPPQAALDASKARSHLLGKLARRILGVVVGLAGEYFCHRFRLFLTALKGLKNAKPTSTVLRPAPVPLGDRCDPVPWWAGGEERRGAPLR